MVTCVVAANPDYLGTYYTNNIVTGTFDFTLLTDCFTESLDTDLVTILRSVTEDSTTTTALAITFTTPVTVTVTLSMYTGTTKTRNILTLFGGKTGVVFDSESIPNRVTGAYTRLLAARAALTLK